ncbi:MAG: UDP-N-acetylglucosamine 2-epimerase (non-hydrolyzing) [Chloroflexi bacterium]|nr:UDP-N-acetylglucosamine 2-epimerase (non-hydrolyzing) [Chloroflexota bacterium]
MKVVTLFGTRPEIIRLSQVIKHLDQFCEQHLVYTGQNYDPNLSDIFFQELEVRKPDIHMGIQSTGFADQVGQIIAKAGDVFSTVQPDRLLVLGDTNSGLSAIVAARMGIPVFHMEAGNRCYDNRVPEEVNRRIIDHSSDVLMPYTHRSKENLVGEGIERRRIFVTGNPIYEVLATHAAAIESSSILENLDLSPHAYFLVTVHRAENVDDPERLAGLLEGLHAIASHYQQPIIVSLHPRTADKIERFGLEITSEKIRLSDPFGFFDFVRLEKQARCVISDSGTVQEECSIFGVPNVTIRDVTERPETIECGSNILSGGAPEDLLRAVEIVLHTGADWSPPPEYMEKNVARTVTKIVLGYHHPGIIV